MNLELSEELGIPKELDEFGDQVFQKFLMGFNFIAKENVINERNGFFNRVLAVKKFNFNEKTVAINYVDIRLIFNKIKSDGQMKFKSANISFNVGRVLPNYKNPRIEITADNIPEIEILLNVPNNTTKNEILNFLKNKRTEITSVITHELKHFIDRKLENNTSLDNRVKYRVLTQYRKDISPFKTITNLLFDLYFLSETENLVRPSEFKSIFTTRKLTKKDFLETYLKSDFHKIYKRSEELTYESFISKLKEEATKKYGEDHLNDVSSDILAMAIENIKTIGEDLISASVSRFANDYTMYGGELNITKKSFDSFLKKQFFLKKDKSGKIDLVNTFKAIISNMNYVAKKMKQKIGKVYASIPDKY
jgi:hypothetical protein